MDTGCMFRQHYAVTVDTLQLTPHHVHLYSATAHLRALLHHDLSCFSQRSITKSDDLMHIKSYAPDRRRSLDVWQLADTVI
eukprot:scaffold21463_cov94-Skeletonema_dohrnii-CCMP3373.AAC.1